MPFQQRLELIRQIETLRNSKVICYLTSLRPGVSAQMAEDSVRIVFDHLLLLPQRPVELLDIFLVSNGGSGTVPWRLVALFREFAKSFNVLIPYRAYSAATLLATSWPWVQTRSLCIHLANLDQLILPLATTLIPLNKADASESALKILKTHMTSEADEHVISEIIESLASKLYFHGHPINRKEAATDLRLKVLEDLSPQLETLIWNLYLDFETEFKNSDIFNPLMGLA